MERMKTYFDVAENDYWFLLDDYKRGKVGGLLCYTSQNICERYLKHIINEFCITEDLTVILRTHSLRVLKKFIVENINDFFCDWNIVLKAEGYYFSTRYPGEDFLEVDEEDVKDCWEAVEETRSKVINYMESKGIVVS